MLKVRSFKSTGDHRPFLSNFDVKLGILFLLQQKFRPSRYTLPPGSSAIYTTSLMGWVGGWVSGLDGVSKVSFKFIYTLSVYRTCIYLPIYIYSKIVTNILMDFKISCQVGGRGQKFQNYSR